MAPTAIITGAARGIGKSISARLLRDGFSVCLSDHPSSSSVLEETHKELKSFLPTNDNLHPSPQRIHSFASDVTSFSSVTDLVSSSVKTLGPLNCMIANAGVVQVKGLMEIDMDKDLDAVYKPNLYGVHHCYTAAAKQMIAQGKPPGHPAKATPGQAGVPRPSAGVYKIIGAASIVAMKPYPLLSTYSASKWAVRGLTQAFAMELAEHGITVNAYAPGIVGTKMWEEIDELMRARTGEEPGAVHERFGRTTLIGRTSVPDDVSNLVSFLAGGDSDYITGQNLIVDGGICFS